MNKITEEIAKRAKATHVDTYVGAVQFNYNGMRFSVLTRKGIREARKIALTKPEKVVFH